MRYGFTTGSCAAAAAKAAAYMLITGKIKNEIEIETPKGIRYHAEITDIRRSETAVSCAVIKDGGDDPDITTGAHIVQRFQGLTAAYSKKNRPCIGKRVRWMAACSKKGSPRIYREL